MNYKVMIKNYDGQGGMKAFATVTLNDMFVIRDFTVREGQNGLFVSFPSKKTKPYTTRDGQTKEYQDIFYPITAEARQEIIEAILTEYNGVEQPQQEGFYPINKNIEDDDLPF